MSKPNSYITSATQYVCRGSTVFEVLQIMHQSTLLFNAASLSDQFADLKKKNYNQASRHKSLLEKKRCSSIYIHVNSKQKTCYVDPLSLTIAPECQCTPSPNEPRPSKNGFSFIGRVRLDILKPQNNWQQPDWGKMSSRTSFASQQRLRTCSQRANHKNCDNQSRRKKTNPRRLRCRSRFGLGKSSGRNSWRQHCFHKKCGRKNH